MDREEMDKKKYEEMNKKMEELIWDRERTPNERTKIGAQMVKILPKILPIINDIKKLIFYWENTDDSSKSEALIEKRMIGLIRDVSADTAIPEWFIEMVKDDTAPTFLKGELQQKTIELLQQL